MIFYIGKIASGKSTLYRKLNEEKTLYAVEIELPQSCIADEEIKQQLFDIFYHSKNIEAIIAHPYYLPHDFAAQFDPSKDEVRFLEVGNLEQHRRILLRSLSCDSKCQIFPESLLEAEDKRFKELKQEIAERIKSK